MSNWRITFADNLNDAYRKIGFSKKSILIENNDNNSIKVYMANKENIVFLIEEGALGIPPEIQEGMGGIFVGMDYNVFCFDKSLKNSEKTLKDQLANFAPNTDVNYGRKLAKSTRYEGLYMNYILDKFHIDVVEQFYAMTFIFDKFIFVGFRGTDTTFIGWKEDFNIALMDVIPSQVDATEYLNKVGNLIDKPILVGGHSKGGNLSLYATMYCENNIRNRIHRIFNHDGPGFNKDVYETKEFLDVKDKMMHYKPLF